MNLNHATALTLRIFVVIGIAMMVAGLAMSLMDMGDAVLYAGILVLIVSPFAGVIVTFIALIQEKDWYWVTIAAILLAITAVGLGIAML